MKTNCASRAAFFNLRVLIGFALCSVGLLRASAQSPAVSGGGTKNYIPVWTSSSGLGNSSIYQSPVYDRISIGTTQTLAALELYQNDTVYSVLALNAKNFGTGYGINGQTSTPAGAGVGGIAHLPGAKGVEGINESTTGLAFGVEGVSASPNGIGVAALNSATTGSAFGVLALSSSTSGRGVEGIAGATTGSTVGVYGLSTSTAGTGVYGIGTGPTGPGGFPVGVQGYSTNGAGVSGVSTNNSGGVFSSTHGDGVQGLANSAGAAGYFVNGGSGYLLVGTDAPGGSYMFSVDGGGNGVFAGDLLVGGTLTKGGGSFKIDHPLDPANKYLSHSFVESPDMMGIYNGIIRLDARGGAWVELPDYFDALNRDFRYQLTSVGAPQPRLYIASEVKGNRFRIAGGAANAKVSWQVTGIRQDAWANAHRIPTEEEKPSEKRGTYLHPELYGASADKNKDAVVQR